MIGLIGMTFAAQAGCEYEVEFNSQSGGMGTGQGAATITASTNLSGTGTISGRIRTTSSTGNGCDSYHVTLVHPKLYGHDWQAEGDPNHPASGSRTYGDAPTQLPGGASHPWSVEIAAPSQNTWYYFNIPIEESDLLGDHREVVGLEHFEMSAQARFDAANTPGVCYTDHPVGDNTNDPNTVAADFNKKEDVCIVPASDLPIFIDWKDQSSSGLSRFQGRLKPNGGANRAEFAVSSTHSNANKYLHEVREMDAGNADDECWDLAVDNGFSPPSFCHEHTSVTGGNWLLQPRDTAPVRNQWGHLVSGTSYSKYDNIGFATQGCPYFYINVLHQLGESTCTIKLNQRMDYQCRLGSDGLSSGQKKYYIRPAGDWWETYEQSIPLEYEIKSTGEWKGEVTARRGGVESTVMKLDLGI